MKQQPPNSCLSAKDLKKNQQNGGFYVKAAYSVTFDLLILKIMFLFFKNTVKIFKFR